MDISRNKASILFLTLASVLSFCLDSVADELRAAKIFTDNMVLQRNEPFSIWGWANAGEEVTVALRNQVVTTKSDANGKWMATFQPIKLGTPFTVTIKGATRKITFGNVVAGDVWICSGQSNMEWQVKSVGNPVVEIANGNWPMIRHVRIDHVTSPSKLDDVSNSQWQVCTPQTVGDFSATAYYFGRELHRELDVPIGLLHSSWGGTIIEAWISAESLKNHPDFSDVVETIANTAGDQSEQAKRVEESRRWTLAFGKALEDTSDTWHKIDLDDSDWDKITVPGNWESQGFKDLDGVAWYRHKFKLPDNFSGQKSTISVARIDDIDQTYINGKQVGGLNDWNARRIYEVPGNLLRAGENTIAIRVADGNGAGGIHGAKENVFIKIPGQDPISLAGDWRFKPSTKTSKLGPKPIQPFSGPNHPTLLHNAMINPLLSYNARGVIWYQGESNAGRAYQYRSLMPLLINDWRNKWNKDLSFYWVQLANFTAAATEPGDSRWAELREAQTMALSVPNTGQAVIIDIGEANDIHPKNKQDVGKRLALIALAKDYGKSVTFSGPMYKSMKIEGDKIRLSFDHAEGLCAKGGKLKRFEIAGDDKKFVWAEALIAGNDVVVSSSEVEHPVAVRYAWSDNPEGCNLYNGAGLPASPFRTDQWKGITEPH